MFLIATRRSRPTEDPIFSLNQEASQRRAKGEDILNGTLGATMDEQGNPALFASMLQALRSVSDQQTSLYAPIAGANAYLEAVKDDMLGSVPELRANAVAVATPGGTGALHHALINFLEPGQAALTSNYYWTPYHTIADECGRSLDTFKLFDDQGGFNVPALDAAVAEQIQRQGRVLLMINDPCHNPTGFSMSRSEWKEVADCLIRHAKAGASISLLVDVAYIEFAGSGDPREFLQELVPLAPHVQLLFAWSASKALAMYGQRVGALLAVVPDAHERKATQAALAYSCRGTWSNCNHAGMIAATTLLNPGPLRDQLLAERAAVRTLLQARVARFNELAKPAGLSFPRYDGGFFVTVFHPDAPAQAAKMREHGVFVVPWQGDALRVALCGVPETSIERMVQALALP